MRYDYQCTKCYKTTEVSMSMAEHEQSKGYLNAKTVCSCGYAMVQQVAKLRFKLEGQGWGPSDTNPDAYGITSWEMNSNLDMEKRIEDGAYEMQAKDKANGECEMTL